MSEQIDEEWEREKRYRRYICLKEDEPVFGLIPSEEAEFKVLKREFESHDH